MYPFFCPFHHRRKGLKRQRHHQKVDRIKTDLRKLAALKYPGKIPEYRCDHSDQKHMSQLVLSHAECIGQPVPDQTVKKSGHRINVSFDHPAHRLLKIQPFFRKQFF